MAPLSPANTERWWLHYEVNSLQHTMQMRTTSGASNTNVSLTFHGLLIRLAPQLFNLTITNMERSLQGSNVRNPFPYTQQLSYGTGSGSGTDARARTLSFIGRDVAGRRVRIYVFGWNLEAQGDYRFTPAEESDLAAALTYLQGISTAWLSINALAPVWSNYANINYSDHWIKQLR